MSPRLSSKSLKKIFIPALNLLFVGFDAHKKKNRKEISNRSWFGDDPISPVSAKIPGISLRKRKRSSTDDYKDDWKKTVIAKSSKTETATISFDDHSNDEKIQARVGSYPQDDLGLDAGKNIKTKSQFSPKDSSSDSERQFHSKVKPSSSTEKDSNLNYSNSSNDQNQLKDTNSLSNISNEKEQSSEVSSQEINTNNFTSSSKEETPSIGNDTQRGEFSHPIASCSLVSGIYSDSDPSDEDA